jgi:Tol biopolymer transport system component
MKWSIVSITLALGCGSVPPPMHQVDAGSSNDAVEAADAPAAGRCDPSASFGAPVAITELNSSSSDEGATLTPDELTIYFDSSRPGGLGGYDIYVATRTSRTDHFSEPALLAGVNTAGNERNPTVTGDGLTLYATNGGGSTFDMLYATRASSTSSFSSLAPVTGLGSTGSNSASIVLPNGSAVYLTSGRTGTYQLYRTVPAGSPGAMDTPTLLTGTNLSVQGNNMDPVVTPDELTLYFASDRGAAGTPNIYVATRASTAVGFDDPIELPSLSVSNQVVYPTWVSADNCVLYFTAGSPGGYRLYVASKPPQ